MPAMLQQTSLHSGRILLQESSEVDPVKLVDVPLPGVEDCYVKSLDVAKMKNQRLSCAVNAGLLAVNSRYITYAMKEGEVRVINQNRSKIFKVANSSASAITDLALNHCARKLDGFTDGASVLVVLDSEGRVTVLSLDAKAVDDRVGRIELRWLGPQPPPTRVLGHPTDPQLFATLHAESVIIWDVAALERVKSSKRVSRVVDTAECDYEVHCVDPALVSQAGCVAANSATLCGLLDLSFSTDGNWLLVLTYDSVLAWKRVDDSPIKLQCSQQCMLESLQVFAISSLRVVGCRSAKGSDRPSFEVLALLTAQGAKLLALEFNSSIDEPIGPVVQRISLKNSKEYRLNLCVVDVHSRDRLIIVLEGLNCVFVLPLALDWYGGRSGPPFPCLDRICTAQALHQLTAMTGTSVQGDKSMLFLYCANNFIREKDGLNACNVIALEVSLEAVSRWASVKSAESFDDDKHLDTKAKEDIVIEEASVSPLVPPTEELVALEQVVISDDDCRVVLAETTAEKIRSPDLDGLEQPPLSQLSGLTLAQSESPLVTRPGLLRINPRVARDDAEVMPPEDDSAPSNPSRKKGPDVSPQSSDPSGGLGRPDEAITWAFMKHIAGSFVKGLEKRRGEMSDRIVHEVVEALKVGSESTSLPSDEWQALESAMREAQAAGEKSLVASLRKATDAWAEASVVSVSGAVQKELGRLSDGVAGTLASHLSNSKKFCDALAKAVQRSGSGATKQALEGIRTSKQFQDAVGQTLLEVLRESLAPVFRQEVREMFEKELAPLIGQRVSDMMSAFKERMGACLDSIAEQHEEAARRLGAQVASTVADELRSVEAKLAGHRDSNYGGLDSHSLSDSQLDELAQVVDDEVVKPLRSRVQELSAQVEELRQHARQLEQRWNAAAASANPCVSADAMVPRANLALKGTLKAQPTPAQAEESQAAKIDRIFNEGRHEQAFMEALVANREAHHVDFLDRVCAKVEEPLDEWLGGSADRRAPLGLKVRVLLMVALAQQLAGCEAAARSRKLEWIEELWLAFDAPAMPQEGARDMVRQLLQNLDAAAASEPPGYSSVPLRRLRAQVKSTAKLLQTTA